MRLRKLCTYFFSLKIINSNIKFPEYASDLFMRVAFDIVREFRDERVQYRAQQPSRAKFLFFRYCR